MPAILGGMPPMGSAVRGEWRATRRAAPAEHAARLFRELRAQERLYIVSRPTYMIIPGHR